MATDDLALSVLLRDDAPVTPFDRLLRHVRESGVRVSERELTDTVRRNAERFRVIHPANPVTLLPRDRRRARPERERRPDNVWVAAAPDAPRPARLRTALESMRESILTLAWRTDFGSRLESARWLSLLHEEARVRQLARSNADGRTAPASPR